MPESSTSAVIAERVTPETLIPAARRLVGQEGDTLAAARRLIAAAPAHGIDLTNIWLVREPGWRAGGLVRQAALFVFGAGRTAMTFVSDPLPGNEEPGGQDRAQIERVACLQEGFRFLRENHAERVRLVQALSEREHVFVHAAFAAAGYRKIGDLRYLRRPMKRWKGSATALQTGSEQWQLEGGVRVESFIGWRERLGDAASSALCALLEQTYEETLDCPELRGLRETQDILESHRSTGVWNPHLWYIALRDAVPVACALINPVPAQRSAELVYLGVSPRDRGRGLGRALLEFSIHRLHLIGGPTTDELVCAVDARNTPAIGLYAACGFAPFGQRVAHVRPV